MHGFLICTLKMHCVCKTVTGITPKITAFCYNALVHREVVHNGDDVWNPAEGTAQKYETAAGSSWAIVTEDYGNASLPLIIIVSSLCFPD